MEEEFIMEDEKVIRSNGIIATASEPPRRRTLLKVKTCFQNHLGIALGTGAGFSFALTEILAKILTQSMPAGQILILRNAVHAIINLIILMVQRKSLAVDENEIVYVTVRGTVQSLATLALYVAFWYLPFVDAIVIMYGLYIFFSVVIARIWLKEKVSAFEIVILILVVIGVVLSSEPASLFNITSLNSSGFHVLVGVIFAIVSAILHAVTSCVNRRITKTDALVVTFYIGFIGSVIGGIYGLIDMDFRAPESSLDILYSVLIGVSSMAANYLWTRGLQSSSVAAFMIAGQSQIPFGILLQIIMMNLIPHNMTIIGACLIVCGVFLLTAKDNVRKITDKMQCCTQKQKV